MKCLIFVDGETLIFRMLIVSANGGKKRSHYKISNAGMKESIFTLLYSPLRILKSRIIL